jgi:hypothetical protein
VAATVITVKGLDCHDNFSMPDGDDIIALATAAAAALFASMHEEL